MIIPRTMHLPRFLSSPSLWRFLVLLWFGVLFWLSSQSHLPSPAKFEGVDKIEHVIFFAAGGMCFLLGLRLAGFAQATKTAILLTVLFCGAVGGFDEWHQTFTPGRSGGDVWDFTADLCGGFIGAFLALIAERWLTSEETTTSAAR
ncbi:VanZ family protein [Prosthecobacter sp.]|uniref:VanZ family protein n=1 Tax=Prosthecobacter sp. TaxID=1965333 RepID=UPI002489EDD3|nr:VanZ family protein [Prosthecobacter sp.]MDI1311604.1 VanZ family protein [Prosthecobacter sp.]